MDVAVVAIGVTILIAIIGMIWRVNSASEDRVRAVHERINAEREDWKDEITNVHKTLNGYVHKDVVLQLIDAHFTLHNSKLENVKSMVDQRCSGIERSLRDIHKRLEEK